MPVPLAESTKVAAFEAKNIELGAKLAALEANLTAAERGATLPFSTCSRVTHIERSPSTQIWAANGYSPGAASRSAGARPAMQRGGGARRAETGSESAIIGEEDDFDGGGASFGFEIAFATNSTATSPK